MSHFHGPNHAIRAACLLVLCQSRIVALSFNIVYDSSTAGAPAAFFTAFNHAAMLYENAFDDPITINLQVGWGKINGANLAAGNRAQTSAFQLPFTFNQVRNALSQDTKSADDTTSIASLPVVDPVGGAAWVMARAEAKALGLLPGNDANVHPATGLARPDGYIGFMNDTASYAFDPDRRVIAGKYDFIGIASHEITELMGRFGQGQNVLPGSYSPLDLFRYLSSGTRDWALADAGAYFSIDGGNTVINTFRGKLGGDPSDWLGSTADSFNAIANTGQLLVISPGDIIAMDVLGYDSAANLEFLRLVAAATGGGRIVLRWESVVGRQYQLFYRGSLTSLWRTLGAPVIATDATSEVTETMTNEARFYQVRLDD